LSLWIIKEEDLSCFVNAFNNFSLIFFHSLKIVRCTNNKSKKNEKQNKRKNEESLKKIIKKRIYIKLTHICCCFTFFRNHETTMGEKERCGKVSKQSMKKKKNRHQVSSEEFMLLALFCFAFFPCRDIVRWRQKEHSQMYKFSFSFAVWHANICKFVKKREKNFSGSLSWRDDVMNLVCMGDTMKNLVKFYMNSWSGWVVYWFSASILNWWTTTQRSWVQNSVEEIFQIKCIE